MYDGLGLHSGKPVHMEFRPAKEETGLVFVRTDVKGEPTIVATAKNVTKTNRATMLEENGVRVFTVEHILSALHIFGIQNCYIALDSEEPPVADGSAFVFFKLLQDAGRMEQEAKVQEIVIRDVFRIDDGDRFVMIVPYPKLRVSFTSLNPVVGTEYFDIEVSHENYLQEIAPARTIASLQEIETLRAMGLGLGGTLENVIVYDESGWINELRFKNELVRHKILDLLGDMRLVGNIKGHIIAVKSSHELNTQLAKKIVHALNL